ncbi:putative house-cleaning noncanonical NTP pyrophosphatase (MazG superfamily) [Salirhabdus euzebyi]|uniref:Putative house-cleaning noncanonical NTP pyrophosphatase (MazG superfamily) n=1 Tax=Salirhabdus euzebyi TaxID=394506 RepID=A0A841Q349_9BACI|nr:nucleoside triphosphate pyrophosphohydrolase [Salirhabdus euzebyi]MBB6452568.1 putative house-cleaning noncanonical NTP pyrophosphatase (MazG superfamily) [Salirhabdus euzebyi]
MPTYNKLVRDKIPDIIKDTGKKLNTRILSDQEYILELKNKTQEELQEYLNANNNEDALEELADLLELIHALAKVHGSSIEEVDKLRRTKTEKRGAFDDKVFLIDVE